MNCSKVCGLRILSGGATTGRRQAVRAGFAIIVAVILAAACAPPVGPPGPTPTPTAKLASGGSSVCAVTPAGTVKCWGGGYLGLAGTTTRVQRLAATTVDGITDAVAVDMSQDPSWGSSCVLRGSGTVACWGANSVGQLGDGSTIDRLTPVDVLGVSGAVGVAVSAGTLGLTHACAVLDTGRVRCWGSNDHGQLGDGSTIDRSTPVEVAGLGNATQVAVGPAHSCALLDTGSVSCWGAGAAYELGNPLPLDQPLPVSVLALPPSTVITAGGDYGPGGPRGFSCALSVDGTEWCWGQGGPTSFDPTLPRATGVADLVDLDDRCAITSGRTVVCSPSGSNSWAPLAGVDHVADVTDLGGCILREDGTVQCTGRNEAGRLGNGSGTFVAAPQPPVTGITTAAEVSASSYHSCARLTSGGVSCWGNGLLGQRGDGTTSYQSAPTMVTGIPDATALGSGEYMSCAVRAGGTVWCWGTFSGTTNTTPVQIPGIADAVHLDGGQGFMCAVRSGGAMACWGNNTNGELGDGTTTSSATPVAVTGITDAIGLAAGFNHACALRATGTVSCWGRNSSGEVGDGTRDQRTTPVAISGLSGVGSLSAGFGSTCAVRDDGTTWCWGDNASDLGPSWSPDLTLAAPVPGLATVAQGVIENGHLCVQRTDGTVRCLGSSYSYGLLGDGTYLGASATPVEPIGLPSTSGLTTGDDHMCALADAGTVRCGAGATTWTISWVMPGPETSRPSGRWPVCPDPHHPRLGIGGMLHRRVTLDPGSVDLLGQALSAASCMSWVVRPFTCSAARPVPCVKVTCTRLSPT